MVIQLNAGDYTLCRGCEIWYNAEKYGECPLCMAHDGIERVLEREFDIAEAFERFRAEIARACERSKVEEEGDGGRLGDFRGDIEKALQRLKGATVTRL